MALKKLCSKCPRHSLCVEICKDLEKELGEEIETREVLGYDMDYIDALEHAEEDQQEPRETRYQKDIISSGKDCENNDTSDDELSRAFFSTPLMPNLENRSITEQELNKLMKKYDYLFKDKKDKRYFKSYLKCATLDKIASLSGVTPQAIHKRYINWMALLIKGVGRGKNKDREIVTPYKFKQAFIISHD
jgi:hypothetical protein